MNKRHKSKGITLVSLVITIILLLILASISIQAITNTGLFENAFKARQEAKRGQIEEWLSLKLLETQTTSNTSKTAEQIIEATRQNVNNNIGELKAIGKDVTVEETSTEEDGEEVDIYFCVVVDKDVYKVELKGVKFIGELGKFPPIIKIASYQKTTNSITVQVTTKRNEGGELKYYIKGEDDTEYKIKATKTDTETTHTFEGLDQNKNYSIKIVAIAENEQTAEVTKDVNLGSVPDLAVGDITFTYTVDGVEINENTWTNKAVNVTANTDEKGFTLQTKKDAQTWSSVKNQIFTENGQMHVRLWDGRNAGGTATANVTNIDTLAPKEFTPETSSTTKSITVTASTTDAEATDASGSSGIAGYRFKLDSGTWTDYQASGTYTWDNLEQTTNHTITVEAKDNAGNTTTGTTTKGTGTVAQLTTADTTFTYKVNGQVIDKATWTNQNVTVTVSTTVTGYTLQTSTNGKDWSNETSQTFTQNGTVHARLWDGKNGGKALSANVTNIDTTAPSTPTITYNSGSNECRWENNINITLSSSDSQSGIAYYEIDWDNDGNADTTTGSNFIPWNGYYGCVTRFRAVDNAGNPGEWTSSVHIHMDTEAPTHTNWWWGEVTKDVARLYIQATDDVSGIARVVCPTSTASGGYGNWYWFETVWDSGANAYRADITPATFGHYGQTYLTHLYIYDHAGNGGYYNQTTVNIPSLIATAPSGSTTHTATAITYSWAELSTIAKMISNNSSITNDTAEVSVTLNGATKTIGVGDTATVDGQTVRILGFNHDTLTTSTAYGAATATGKAGISFEYVTILTSAQMNSYDTNSGGWGSCALKGTLNGTTYNSLSIKSYIKQVQKEYIQTYNDANSKTYSSDYLWLLSCGEIWNNGYNGGVTRGHAVATEGSQYKYYKSTLGSTSYSSFTDITIKPNSSNSSTWMLRSPFNVHGGSFLHVNTSGSCYANGGAWICGVAPGFSV